MFGLEWIYDRKPTRGLNDWKPDVWSLGANDIECDYIQLPKGTIEKIIGRALTWDDEPVMI